MTRLAPLPRALMAGLLLAAAGPTAHAQDTGPPPLYTHTDQGPVTVMHGGGQKRLPLGDTRQAVQDYVGDVNALLAQGDEAQIAALEDAIARGRALQETDTALTGTLYVEEAIRRLKRARLARVPVEDTNVYAEYAEQYPERFAKRVVLRRGVDDLGVSYATLAACLELAEVPNAKPPHKVRVEPDGAIWTRLNGTPLALDLVEYQGNRMLLRSIVLGTSRSLGFKDKAQVARMLLDTCV
ncbi:hypothetical protein CKO28_08635 [Rhodovibrio sodomensis]|uniref:DUF4124 domain-containing protein n=1 Tax=Rhodovibrio sodomensis TaxID=1088 RepID=A0ABS1DDA5_9PROT|nr:hypothetical protein [Rhodovibrio sodomensis]MBK1668102.1 hypothetical protein [Rhodovibrio sodomensis]